MNNLGPIVDELGRVKAMMANLAEREEALKAQLIEAGPGAYEGALFRVTVSKSERANLDLEAVRSKLSPQFLRAHTSYSPVTTVRVVARTAQNVAA